MATLNDLISKCVIEIKTDPNKKIWNDETLTDYINTAIRQIENDGWYGWDVNAGSATITTVAGTQEYSLPSDFVKMEGVYLDSCLLSKTNKQTVLATGNDSTSKPNSYYLRGGKVGFYSIPDGSYSVSILYKRKTEELSTENPDLEFDNDFVTAIVKYACYLAWSSPRGSYNDAQAKLADYEKQRVKLFSMKIANDTADFTFTQPRGSLGFNDKVIY